VDEVHFLYDERGPALEVIMTRLRLKPNIRIIAVSATVENIEDIAKWIGEGWSSGGDLIPAHVSRLVPATTLKFGEEYRPVKLEKYCYGVPPFSNENDFQFDSRLNNLYAFRE